jgi:multiple sugar transport system ATP-binding protein
MADVVLRNLSKTYDGEIVAVSKVNIDVAHGEFVVLVGPSGCGKSTTLRMVAGLEEATEGEILIDGQIVNEVPPKDRDIAMVFQNYALYPHMTVYQNMAFGLKLRKFGNDEIDRRVQDAAGILGIADLLDRRPKELSGGQRQRVAVGRAIVRKPKVFLFDEPLSNLDANLRVQMRAEISKLHAQIDATMIYVTHDQVEAMTMGDRIVVMRDGVVQQIDQPLELYNWPKNRFVAGFIGNPGMNFFHGRIVADHLGNLGFDDGALKLRLPSSAKSVLKARIDRRVILGVRPEHIRNPETMGRETQVETISARVEVIEPMGNDVFLYLNSGSSSFVARVESDHVPNVQDDVSLGVAVGKIHFFDEITELNIALDSEEDRS